ncbi:DUF2243 domain-containing protein [Halobium salinum]|uniref:DUF2243 domain-containing protein n=1 Tax=Halobium salinum TaxID=1364940 RepID=A0ABD5PH47_9EURY|nr:DUF2243 domain-containing protein [Halobium salinum]
MDDQTRRGLVGAGVFGFGVSGLVDVLVLHLVFQWHHLVSNVVSPATLSGLRTNLVADGLFSVAMLVVALAGAGVVWRAERRAVDPLPARALAGAALFGLGTFDVFDVVVNHWLLGLHHAVGMDGAYDPHWFVVSLLLAAAGVLVYRNAEVSRT